MKINTNIKDMLIGNLLGDSHIKRVGLSKAYITFEQSLKKKEYLEYLYNLINNENLAFSEPKIYTRKDKRYESINSSLYFRTKSIEEFKFLSDIFLSKTGTKIIPADIAIHLNYRSLAFWIMDDGQEVKNGGVTLCTDSFTFEEVDLLKAALESKFNILTSIHNKKGKENYYKRIYIGKSSLNQLKPLLEEHMHETMLYKIGKI